MKRLNVNNHHIAVISAVSAAVLYAICIPCAKLLSIHTGSTFLGAFLYLGAGLGLFITSPFIKNQQTKPLTKKELPYTIAMILLDIGAIIFLMFGIARTNSANVSLLGNFELVATVFAAFLIFKEAITKKLLLGIILITIASIILSFEGKASFVFSTGSIFVVLSCIFWGLENNCTRAISSKDTRQITTIKGIFSGIGSLVVALVIGEAIPDYKWILTSLLLGFISYGISVCLYIYSQRYLGAAKTGALYSIAQFAGVFFSIIILKERPEIQFYIALCIMIIATILVINDSFNSHNS